MPTTPILGGASMNLFPLLFLIVTMPRIKLAFVLQLPSELQALVYSQLAPKDLIALARTTKQLRKYILDKSARPIWQASLANVPPSLSCPPELSEPAYAAIVFDNTCTRCNGKVGKQGSLRNVRAKLLLCREWCVLAR